MKFKIIKNGEEFEAEFQSVDRIHRGRIYPPTWREKPLLKRLDLIKKAVTKVEIK